MTLDHYERRLGAEFIRHMLALQKRMEFKLIVNNGVTKHIDEDLYDRPYTR